MEANSKRRLALTLFVPFSYFCTCWKVILEALASSMVGVASACMAVAPSAFAAPKLLGCDRTSVDLQVVITTYTGCKLKWWGAHFTPGSNPGGGGDNTTVVSSDPCYKPPRCPPPPCHTVWLPNNNT